ncbi:MAG: hypothetical protein ACE5OS_08930 [Anaerolineae bacterium]
MIALSVNLLGVGLAPLPAIAAPALVRPGMETDVFLGVLPSWFTAVPAADAEGHDASTARALPAWFATSEARPGIASLALDASPPEVYTNGAGRYHFEGLSKGTHKVIIDLSTLPPHLRPARGEAAPVLWLAPGMERTSDLLSTSVRFTAAYDREARTIAGLVFVDQDGDGRPGPGEPGIPGVRVIDPTVHQYFAPFNDANLWTLFDDKSTGLPGAQQCHSGGVAVGGTLNSSIFLIASSDGTIFYYDHWEDGYDADPLIPGSTTEVGVLDAGALQLFRDNIDPAQVPDTDVFFYDGRDRITVVGMEASVVRQVFPSTPGVVLASAWEMPEVADWGTSFIATVGEDLDPNTAGGGVDDHDFAGLEIMAALPGTEVYYNGALVATLGPGGTHFIDGANDGAGVGGVNSTDVVTATAPIQVQMMTGGCGDPYSAHGYTLQPADVWTNDYWAPVPGFSCGGDVADSDIYLHNPNSSAISVTAVSDLGTVVVSIPAQTTISLLDYVVDNLGWADISTGSSGLHLFSADTFWGVGVIDSSSNGRNQSETYDWGYSLIPTSKLSSQAVVGYAPGNNDVPPSDNGNSAFVTVITDTVIYVDLNQDGLPDPFDMNGDGDADDNDVFGVAGWDEPLSALGVSLLAGQAIRVGDPDDRNLQGALIYTLDYEDKIAVAWGQDPCRSDVASPYLDLGYTVLPASIPSLSKVDELAIDADLSGGFSPGDTITYTLVLQNNGLGSMNDVVLTDTLPYTYTDFVAGSLQVTTPPPTDTIEYYNGTWVTTPVADAQMFRITWPTIGPWRTVTITFRLLLHLTIPVTVTEITNQAVVDSANTDPTDSEDPDDPPDPDTDTPVARPLLSINKTVSPTVVSPDGRITYTVVVSNYGDGVALLTQISDTLPAWIEYVPGTLDLSWPIPQVEIETLAVTRTSYFHGYYADDFDLTATQPSNYTGDDGTLTWSTPWTEVNDDGDPTGGDVQVGTLPADALSEPAYLMMTNGYVGAYRVADLSEFRAPRLRYYVAGDNDDADDEYRVGVGTVSLQERHTGDYTIRQLDLSPIAGAPAAALHFTATSALEPDDSYRFDNVAIYETDPERVVTETLTSEQIVLSYTTSTGGDPVSYDPLTGHMVITQGVRLLAGGFITATFQAQVGIPLPDDLTLANTACTTAANWLEVLSPPCDDAAVQIESDHALTIAKAADPSPVEAGGRLTYTIHYTITGDEAVEEMAIRDTTPVGTAFYSATPIPTSDPGVGNAGPVIWQVSGLWPPGSGVTQVGGTLTMVVLVDAGLVSDTLIVNNVIITDTTGLTDTDTITTPVAPPSPGLEIVKAVAPGRVVRRMPFTYSIRINNTGLVTFTEVMLADTLPSADFHYIRGTGLPADPDTIAEPLLVWDDLVPLVGPLPPGDSITVTFAVTATPSVTGTYVNVATATVTTPAGVLTDTDDAPVSLEDPAVEIDKEIASLDDDDVYPNYVTFTIAITNVGPSVIDVLPLLDQYEPYFLSFADGTPYPEEDADDGLLTWNDLTGPAPYGFGRNLPPGESFLVTTIFRVTHDIEITTTNTATVTGAIDVYDNPANEDEDEVDVGGEGGQGIPTPVEVIYFRALAEESAVRLEWGTAAELGTLGFYVKRAPDADVAQAQTIAYVPATGPDSTYSHVDRDVTPGQPYWYWLVEEVSFGAPDTYGPVQGGVGIDVLPYRLYFPLIQGGRGERAAAPVSYRADRLFGRRSSPREGLLARLCHR